VPAHFLGFSTLREAYHQHMPSQIPSYAMPQVYRTILLQGYTPWATSAVRNEIRFVILTFVDPAGSTYRRGADLLIDPSNYSASTPYRFLDWHTMRVDAACIVNKINWWLYSEFRAETHEITPSHGALCKPHSILNILKVT